MPKTGSSTIKPANVARMTRLTATVALIMFSTLIPFCVWFVSVMSVYLRLADLRLSALRWLAFLLWVGH
jgi:hypothetical protein